MGAMASREEDKEEAWEADKICFGFFLSSLRQESVSFQSGFLSRHAITLERWKLGKVSGRGWEMWLFLSPGLEK